MPTRPDLPPATHDRLEAKLERLDRELAGYLGRRRTREQYALTPRQWAQALYAIVGGLSTHVDELEASRRARVATVQHRPNQ